MKSHYMGPFIESTVRATCLSVVIGLLAALVPNRAIGQTESPVTKINQAAAEAEITTEYLRGNISVLMGSGGNITVLDGPNGKLMVDAGVSVSCRKIKAALGKLGSKPVRFLVNTHWHWDHTDGNKCIRDEGATIISQTNTTKRLSVATRVEDWNFTFEPSPADARPTVLFKTDKTQTFAGETVVLKGFGAGHTDTDIIVYFKKADVMVLGDIFWNGFYPFIDNSTGGSIDGAIRLANDAILRVSDKTLIVPGHGPVANRAQLIEFRDMLVGVRANVSRLKRLGKSVDEVVAAKPTSDYDAKWSGFVIDPDFFARLVYQGL